MKKKVLFIGGTLNQTTIIHQVAVHLEKSVDCFFTPFYSDGLLDWMAEKSLLDFTLLGGKAKEKTLHYFDQNGLTIDPKGVFHEYDLVVMPTDTIVPKNVIGNKIVLIQEGMIVPEDWKYYVVRKLGLPRFLANTASTGLSDVYVKFCVASEGFKEIFAEKGVKSEKIAVTGIPNFDNYAQFQDNDFPHYDYVLGATSCLRETFQYENRKAFIYKVLEIAKDREVIFKLHPNEDKERAIREINQYAPDAKVFYDCDINPIIANCSALVTKYSSVIMTGLGLGKKVYSDFDDEHLKKLSPIQNDGTSSKRIAEICQAYLN